MQSSNENMMFTQIFLINNDKEEKSLRNENIYYTDPLIFND